MPVQLSEKMKKFAGEVYPAIVGTKRSDGTVQINPVWFELRDSYFWLNAGGQRRWLSHLKKDNHVTLLLLDPKDMFRWAQVQGRLVETTPEGGDEHIDRLSLRYTGKKYQGRIPGEVRTIVKVEPLRITGSIDGWR